MKLITLLRLSVFGSMAATSVTGHALPKIDQDEAEEKKQTSRGCGKDLGPVFSRGKLTGDLFTKNNRRYQVFIPKSYNKNTHSPLILSYHGANRHLEDQIKLDQFTDPMYTSNYIVVYLQGTADDPKRPEHTTWDGAPGHKSDDMKFTEEVLDHLDAHLCVNHKRIYATGKSQGGGFVNRLACDPTMSKRIAAFAPVSGAYYNSAVTTTSTCNPNTLDLPCNPGRDKIPILAYHGGADVTISWDGMFRSGACLPSIPHWRDEWLARNGLKDAQPKRYGIPGSREGERSVYGDGLFTLVYDGFEVGHSWPTKTSNEDNKGRVAAFEATPEILEFFSKHKLP